MRTATAGLLARGSPRSPGLPGFPVALRDERSPLTVAGAATAQDPARGRSFPCSLFIPQALSPFGGTVAATIGTRQTASSDARPSVRRGRLRGEVCSVPGRLSVVLLLRAFARGPAAHPLQMVRTDRHRRAQFGKRRPAFVPLLNGAAHTPDVRIISRSGTARARADAATFGRHPFAR
jgi:hypothetical protein